MASPAGRGPKTRKWQIDFCHRTKSDKAAVNLVSPPGYSPESGKALIGKERKEGDEALIMKRSWDIALGPIKQIPMNLFIMWMAGNTISIFPIMMVGMSLFRPIQAMIAYQSAFRMIEGGQALFQKFVWILGNFLILLLAMYKCHGMGLLPTHASDWLAFVETPKRLEWSGGGLGL
ncbi:ER membrane protein complex subunit 4 [Lingula anatina]|uniref:ER membrane protein complex subunit 4 n=1 Tax=Lingula anatina TaxID=7574 RepID=A0A1S3JB00_LINAN|nr:ER membrane protein complex subunit 4 [Lingula anatina]|eukprot:XP_013407572.1 ER membrane protein complex subunit 4 [Lingula anatina]